MYGFKNELKRERFEHEMKILNRNIEVNPTAIIH